MRKIFSIAAALIIALSTSVSLASERLIEATGNYTMDSRLDETPASATARAREEAKRIAVEKAGVYLQTYSKMVNLELDVDEVQTVAARLLKIQEETSDVKVVEKNLLKFSITIKALVDDLDENDLKTIMQDKQSLSALTRQNKELQEKYDVLNQQMKEYRDAFDKANAAQKVKLKKEVALNVEKFSALNEFAKGNDFSARKDYPQALAFYDAAIKLDPQLAEAYNNRGIIKYELGQFAAAVEDYTKALKLKSNFVDAYNNRGNAYAALSQFQKAKQDLQAALKLNNKSADGHNNLGNVYYSMKNYDAAIEEYTLAIQLNQNFVEAYYNRAVAHYVQGNLIQSLSDIKKARELKSNDGEIKDFLEKISRKAA